MNEQEKMDKTRRNLLIATSVAGGAASLGAAIPFAASWLPSERSKAAGAPVEVDISTMVPGELKIIEWRGKPVWILKRTKEMLDSLKTVAPKLSDPASKSSEQPEYAKNDARARKPDVMVMSGVCTHLGCSPQIRTVESRGDLGADWAGGFYCPCHGSKFDYSGRVFKGAPAPTNLAVPPHVYLSDGAILVGLDEKEA